MTALDTIRQSTPDGQRAFSSLCARFLRGRLRYKQITVTEDDRLPDLAQDIALRASVMLRDREELTEHTLRAAVGRGAVFAVADYIKEKIRASRIRTTEIVETLAERPRPLDDKERQSEAEQKQRFLAIVDHLPRGLQEYACILAYTSLTEPLSIGQELNISRNTSKQRFHRLKAALTPLAPSLLVHTQREIPTPTRTRFAPVIPLSSLPVKRHAWYYFRPCLWQSGYAQAPHASADYRRGLAYRDELAGSDSRETFAPLPPLGHLEAQIRARTSPRWTWTRNTTTDNAVSARPQRTQEQKDAAIDRNPIPKPRQRRTDWTTKELTRAVEAGRLTPAQAIDLAKIQTSTKWIPVYGYNDPKPPRASRRNRPRL